MLGNRLKDFRKSYKITQQGLAERLNTSSGYISEIESGKTMPGGNFLISLKREFNINSNWLLTGEGDMFLEDKNKASQIEDLNLIPEIKEIIEDLKQATNKITDLNKLITTPSPGQASVSEKPLMVCEEIAPYISQAADDYNPSYYSLVDGEAACGIPSTLAEDQIIDQIPMPSCFNIKADFVIKTRGESMVEYGITPGMLCFIQKKPYADNGDIVLLAVHDAGTVQPVLRKAKTLANGIVFQNGKGEIMEPGENVEIIGVVTFWMSDIRERP